MTDYKFKILLLGPPAVGKTSLLFRFIKNIFDEDYGTTIGTQILTGQLKFKKDRAKLTLWDIGGQTRFENIRQSFFTGTNGALLVFDLVREYTFKSIYEWLAEMQRELGNDIPFILVGNKEDLIKAQGRDVNPDEVASFAEKHNCTYIETSAKTGKKVRNAFKELTRLIAEKKGIELSG